MVWPFGKKSKEEKPKEEEFIEEEEEMYEPQEVMVQGEIQEPILTNFEKFGAEQVPVEYRRLEQILTSPAVLLGIGSPTDISQIYSHFYMHRLILLSGPSAHISTSIMEFDLLAKVNKVVLNVARNGTLLQAETRFPINPDLVKTEVRR